MISVFNLDLTETLLERYKSLFGNEWEKINRKKIAKNNIKF